MNAINQAEGIQILDMHVNYSTVLKLIARIGQCISPSHIPGGPKKRNSRYFRTLL